MAAENSECIKQLISAKLIYISSHFILKCICTDQFWSFDETAGIILAG
jgi:hypothetical protein